jgi:hypothetical protein
VTAKVRGNAGVIGGVRAINVFPFTSYALPGGNIYLMAKAPKTTTAPLAPGRLLPPARRPLPQDSHRGPGYALDPTGAAEVQIPATSRSGQLGPQQSSRQIAQSQPASTNARQIDRNNIDGQSRARNYR